MEMVSGVDLGRAHRRGRGGVPAGGRRGLGARVLAVALVACWWVPGQERPAARADAPPNQYVGGAVCAGCHQQESLAFRANPHWQAADPASRHPGGSGCEACHGPGFRHATSADPRAVLGFSAMPPAGAQDLCLGCHSDDLGKMHARRSSHATAEVGCTSCHSIHQALGAGPLLADVERELCYDCHADIRARFSMPFKHRVNEGSVDCTDCHNPHGAPVSTWRTAHAPRMVSSALGDRQPCVGCHADKRGPFVHEHAPVRVEGCQSCHEPHGSTNPRLLQRPNPFTLCLECHSDIAGFGARGTSIPGPGRFSHNLTDPAVRECVVCHSRIHGSNVDRWFRR